MIAFANADGGQLVIGVEDIKAGSSVTGFKEEGAYPIEEFEKLGWESGVPGLKLSFEEIPVINNVGEQDSILIITVEKATNQLFVRSDGVMFLRQGDHSVTLTNEEKEQLYMERNRKSAT